jgi:hypothetical protein
VQELETDTGHHCSAYRMDLIFDWACFGPREGAADVAYKIEDPIAERGNVNAKYRVARATCLVK